MAEGTLIVRVTTSRAQIPIDGAAVTLTRPAPGGGTDLVAVRFTDESGRTPPIILATPDASESRAPEPGQPFALVDVEVWHPDYAGVLVENVQVFPGQKTLQDVDLIPLEEFPPSFSGTEVFDLPQQNL